MKDKNTLQALAAIRSCAINNYGEPLQEGGEA